MEEEIVDDNSSSDNNSNSGDSQELLPRPVIPSDPDPDMLVEDSDCPIAEVARVQRIIDGEFTDPEADEDTVVDEEDPRVEPIEEQSIVLPAQPLTQAPPPQVTTPPSIVRQCNKRGFASFTETDAGSMTSAAVVTVSSKKRSKNATTVSSCFKNDAIEIFDSLPTNVPDSPAFRTGRRLLQVARDASDAVLLVNNELNHSNVTDFVRDDDNEIHGDGIDVCETVLIDKKRHRIMLIPGTDFKISESWDNILTEQEKMDPLFKLMKSSVKENLTNPKRIKLLYGLVREEVVTRLGKEKVVERDIIEYLHPKMRDSPKAFILNWLLTKKYENRTSSLKISVAHQGFLFAQLIRASTVLFQKHPIRTPWDPPAPWHKIKEEWLDPLEKRIDRNKVESSSSKKPRKKKVKNDTPFGQPGGSIVTFPISLGIKKANAKWWMNTLPTPCPSCGHGLLVVVESNEDIRNQIKTIDHEYDLSMSIWSSDPDRENKPKPKRPAKMPQQEHIVCMCSVTTAKSAITGTGCHLCEQYVKAKKRSNWDFEAQKSKCKTCLCRCGVYFTRNQWTEVQLQAEEKRMSENQKRIQGA